MRWSGLDELQEELRNLPSNLRDEAAEIVRAAATQTRDETQAIYQQHRRTGNMADHVSLDTQAIGPYGVALRVRATSKHAHLFERGSQARHTSIGANRGSMPATPVLIRIAPRKRREMFQRLKDLLVRHGAKVTGDA